jgi:hypothetical protein
MLANLSGVVPAVEKATSFTIMLATSGWSSNKQTASNSLLVKDGYDYIVAPSPANYSAYNSASIYAQDITTDGSLTFVCSETPTEALEVTVLRIEVES